jgi:hypothetical protein
MEKYDEMVRKAESVKGTEAEVEGLVRVNATTPKDPRSVFSVQLHAGELGAIMEAAERRGMKTGAYIRSAALAAVAGDLDLDRAEKTKVRVEARRHLQELADLISRL